ncbi:MAG TPA: hypothetical protein VF570_17700 [Pyrinomonadaceae bacterium]|jgi:hypothetical protein
MTTQTYTRTNPLIVIRSTTTLVPEEQLREIIDALQQQVTRDFQPAWGIGATIIYGEKNQQYPNAYRINVRRTAGEEDAGYLGYHFSEAGYPVATIFAEEDLKDDKTISDTLSHEVLEMLVDPACNLYAHRSADGARPARGYFYEVCDSVQREKYEIDGHLVCNFVHPEWFEQVWARGSRQFDHLKTLSEPFELLDGCYADVYERRPGQRGHFKTIWGPENDEEAQKRLKHRKKHRNKQRLNIRADED